MSVFIFPLLLLKFSFLLLSRKKMSTFQTWRCIKGEEVEEEGDKKLSSYYEPTTVRLRIEQCSCFSGGKSSSPGGSYGDFASIYLHIEMWGRRREFVSDHKTSGFSQQHPLRYTFQGGCSSNRGVLRPH